MCGLFGIITNAKNTVNVKEIDNAVSLISHRGPDSSSCFTDDNVGLGHCRLAIFDLTDKGKQPMHGWGRTIVFNGAIYNFREIRAELENNGYIFQSDTDTEVILAAFDCFGSSCFEKFNGQWALAIFDPKSKEVFCSRDRFGIKPMYYIELDGNIYFASEIKAFFAIPAFKAILNPTRAAEFLMYRMHDHTTDSFYKNVSSVPKSTHLRISMITLEKRWTKYYSIDQIKLIKRDEEEAKYLFDQLLDTSIDLRLRSDVPVGTALSGGLDSSIIALRAKRKYASSVFNTFSVVYKEEKNNEAEFLNAVLSKADFTSNIISPSFDEMLKATSDTLYSQEEPFNGYGVIAQNLMFKTASVKGVKVMLDGQGGDEIIGGYEKFYLPVIKNLFKKNPFEASRLLLNIFYRDGYNFSDALKALKKYKLKFKDNKKSWLKIDISQGDRFIPTEENSSLEMSKNLLNGLGISSLLRYEDKNAMSYGIESRVPFLDHNLVEFCLSLEDQYKINGGVRKWILRETNRDILPDKLYKRMNKLGFSTPEKKWLSEKDSYYQKAILDNKDMLSQLVDIDQINKHLPSDELWNIYIFSEWVKKFNVQLS